MSIKWGDDPTSQGCCEECIKAPVLAQDWCSVLTGFLPFFMKDLLCAYTWAGPPCAGGEDGDRSGGPVLRTVTSLLGDNSYPQECPWNPLRRLTTSLFLTACSPGLIPYRNGWGIWVAYLLFGRSLGPFSGPIDSWLASCSDATRGDRES